MAGALVLLALGLGLGIGSCASGANEKCPSCVNPGSPMSPFKALGAANRRKVAVFLEASKGRK
jgi:hypothetical protein